jgi:uncharacterized protein (TIGR02996 family)
MQTNPYSDEELGLIDAIHGAPHDDAPRLAYADWLGQHGAGDYAEFIRLQCQQPYVGICNRDPDHPRKSLSWEFPWDDETAKDRLQRLLGLLPGIYRTERFACLAELRFYEEYYRGLPLLEIEEGDWGLSSGVVANGRFKLPPLARVRLSLHTYCLRLAEWLNHPLMYRVDVLRLWLHGPIVDDEYGEEEVEFDVPEIRTLGGWPLLDRLKELNLCAPLSPDAEPLIAELLEPRVFVDTSY